MSSAPLCTPITRTLPLHTAQGSPTPNRSAPLSPRHLIQEPGLLVRAIHDRHRIEVHPPVENRRVDAAEIHVRVEITLHELARLERWHVTVVSALDFLAKHECHASGAVVSAGAVVAHTAAELREDEHDHV